MQLKQGDIPYQYEVDDTPITLANGVEREVIWEYVLEPSTTLHSDGEYYPQVVERLLHKTVYRVAGYTMTSARVHEWRYLDKIDAPATEAMRGYIYYLQGDFKHHDDPVLYPDVALVLAFTPDEKTIPSYIESTDPDPLLSLLTELRGMCADDSAINAWFAPPLDAPPDAPRDISHTMQLMRREVGMKTTRGRVRVLRHVMDAVGVEIGAAGWQLTAAEVQRRQQTSV